MTSPRAEYEERAARRRERAEQLEGVVRRLEMARLAAVVALVALLWAAGQERLVSRWWLLVPVVGFAAVVVVHKREQDKRDRARRATAWYEAGLRRLDEKWDGIGVHGERFLDPHHPYAQDLDVFGAGSLFELLCAARTRPGEETLARWLLAPAAPEEVRARQAAARELQPMLDLREDLAVAVPERDTLDGDGLAEWAERPVRLHSGALRWVCAVLGWTSLAALAWWALSSQALPFVVLFVVTQAVGAIPAARARQALEGVDRPRVDFALLADLVHRLEGETFGAPRLADLRRALDGSPSSHVRHLLSTLEYLEARRNPFFAPFGVVMLWSVQHAYAVEAWRKAHGTRVREWVRVIAEVEALGSFASHAFEHPEDVFPEVLDQGPRFAGQGLGHPLIPPSRCIRNDLTLGPLPRLYMVSGSNMSGKSSLLRTVGTNTVLALAGAPVRATRLEVSPLSVGACIRVGDSLREGISRFYAEILRLRQVRDMADRQPPLLFLLDEILAGTNSHDRRIGAEAVVRALVEHGAVGLVTTHDLALARIADEIEIGQNVHFEDHIADGRIEFDYRLRPGVVQKSNAIALMRAVGLDV